MLLIYTHRAGLSGEDLNGVVQFSRLAGLRAGLDALGITYQHQPQSLPQEGDTVVVLSDTEVLRQMINRKRSGCSFLLVAGPIMELEDTHRTGLKGLLAEAEDPTNPMSLLSELDSILADPEVDAVLTAGFWAKAGWRFCSPSLSNKIHEWRAGVDTRYWDGNSMPEPGRILLYEKRKPVFANKVKAGLEEAGYQVDMIHYGKYRKEELREALRHCESAVVLSQRETQGIALAEMWAMNVPTLCWDNFHTEFNGILVPSSSCPYLTSQTGWRWRNLPELLQVLKWSQPNLYAPREWVSRNMSHEVSAELLLDLLRRLGSAEYNGSLPT